VVGHEGDVGGVVVFGQRDGGEGEIDAVKESKKNLLPLPLCVRGRRR